MKFKTLLKEAKVGKFTPEDLALPGLPSDGAFLLNGVAGRFAGENAAVFSRETFGEDVELSSSASASGPWYSDQGIRFLIWPGNLTIEGDLVDDDFQVPPFLVVRGNLTVRSWLRGGMPAFVGGNVRATGFVIGHYNDSALFVGGDFAAAGYLPRAKPYPDLPKIAPHQFAGKVEARTLDVLNDSDDTLRAALVDDVLDSDEDGVSPNARRIRARIASGLPVWR